MRKRYLPRSAPLSRPHSPSKARRAAATALSTSLGPAWLTSASTDSSAGLSVAKVALGRVKAPSMKKP